MYRNALGAMELPVDDWAVSCVHKIVAPTTARSRLHDPMMLRGNNTARDSIVQCSALFYVHGALMSVLLGHYYRNSARDAFVQLS